MTSGCTTQRLRLLRLAHAALLLAALQVMITLMSKAVPPLKHLHQRLAQSALKVATKMPLFMKKRSEFASMRPSMMTQWLLQPSFAVAVNPLLLCTIQRGALQQKLLPL